jgi:outer membrane protein
MYSASRTRHISAALFALGLTAAAVPAHAVQKGDWLIRLGAAHVAPNDKSGAVTGVGGSGVEVGSSTSLGINFTYMVSDNLGVELLGAAPFGHDIKGTGTVAGLGKIAETKQLPPTLILLYNFAPKASVRPYAGVGLNYTTFFSEKVTDSLSGGGLANGISLKDSTGLAIEAGVDVDIGKDMFFNASLWRMDIDTKATLKGGALDGATVDVTIDPWALFVGVGWRF